MNDKRKAAGVAVALVSAFAAGAYVLSRRRKPEVGEGVPRGEVSISIKPLGKVEGVMGSPAWGVGSTIKVNGKCTAGYPVPTMLLELYDAGKVRKTMTVTSVVLGTVYTLTDTMGSADVGAHTVYGRMVLTNPLGSWEFKTATQSFDIGVVPPGEITLEVTLTPAP